MPAENLTKPCSACHWHLPLVPCFYIYFHKGRRRWYFSSRCKDCAPLLSRANYKVNHRKHREKQREYNLNHKVQKATTDKAYREKNRVTLLRKKSDYAKRPDVRARVNARMRAATGHERTKMNGYSRNARLRNPERRRAICKGNKLKRRNAPGVCTPEQWIAKCDYWAWRCYLCGVSLTSASLHMEHRKPLTRGGSHWPANLAPACEKCNLSKNNKTEAEYRLLLGSGSSGLAVFPSNLIARRASGDRVALE